VESSNILYLLNTYGSYPSNTYTVSDAGDVNNDGYDDVVLGIASADKAIVVSGSNASTLFSLNAAASGEYFGWAVARAGDVNQDGFDDLVIGAPWADVPFSNAGYVQVLSGANGDSLYRFNGSALDEYLGFSVDGNCDVDNDGIPDFVVGGQNANSGAGLARVYSGSTGNIIYTFNGDNAGDNFGYSVACAGDVNNDDYGDVVVGAPKDDNNGKSNSGSVSIYSGINGQLLFRFNGDGQNDELGGAVSGAGDVNNDSFDDVIAGARNDDNAASDAGSARVFSGATGTVLYTFDGTSGSDWFGSTVSDAGDINKDGYADVIVGSQSSDNKNGYNAGTVSVFSGQNGNHIYTFLGDAQSSNLGNSVSSAGDVNADGYPDIVVGGAGYARLFSGRGLWVDADQDGMNDSVDVDDDNDGIFDISDSSPRGNNIDTDGDGAINTFDTDDDADGVPDYIDSAPLNPAIGELPLPLNNNYKGSATAEHIWRQ
jgi:hypothetical protein